MLTHQNKNQHIPVLLEAVLQHLAPEKGERLLDATAGYGGHAEAIIELLGQKSKHILVDRDKFATTYLAEKFKGYNLEICHGDFLSVTNQLANANNKFDLIIADLGVSSPHLNNASRGFSFNSEGPLDMRMDSSSQLTASDIVNKYSEKELEDILRFFGEEPKYKQISKAIVEARPVTTTQHLAQIITKVYGGRAKYKTHPATKTFQALRIAVNDELNQLAQTLPLWHKMLKPGGRLAIISFHSLEDRIVKQYFKEHTGNNFDSSLKLLTKKPIIGDETEIVLNPRARSAKLRAVVKNKQERSHKNANNGKK